MVRGLSLWARAGQRTACKCMPDRGTWEVCALAPAGHDARGVRSQHDMEQRSGIGESILPKERSVCDPATWLLGEAEHL
jgi:hypothetical protein